MIINKTLFSMLIFNFPVVTATAGGKSATCVVTVSDAVIINAPEQLQVAFEDASSNPDSPTKIRLGAGFELELCYGETSDPHRYIELDGGGFTLSNVTGSESDVVTIESTTLKLSNIKLCPAAKYQLRISRIKRYHTI